MVFPKKIALISLLISISSGLFSQENKPHVDLSAISDNTCNLVVTFPEPAVKKTGNGFSNISVAGCGIHTFPGLPALPVLFRKIEITGKKIVSVEIIKTEPVVITGVVPYPWQKPATRNTTDQPDFFLDSSFYNGNGLFPSKIAELKAGIRNGIIINPVQYDAGQKQLIYLKSVTLKIQLEDEVSFKSQKNFPDPTEITNVRTLLPDSNAYIPKLLIVTADEFYYNILPFSDWKLRKGYDVKTVKLSEIGVSPTAAQIKTYITQSVVSPDSTFHPTHILLVGDVGYIPVFIGINKTLTDQPYVLVDSNDYIPDLAIGRFSVNTPAECDTYVVKTINYEKQPYLSGTWFKKATVAASNERLDNNNGLHMISFFLKYSFYGVDDLRALIGKFTNFNIYNALNQGRSWMFYIGHGTETGWTTLGGFTRYTVDNDLKTGQKLPAVISVACSNNDLDYQYGECFGEAWMNSATNNGSIVFVGASELTLFYLSDTLGKHMVFNYINGRTENIGDALTYGKIVMQAAFPDNIDGETEETMQQFLILGDPTLMPWTDIPVLPLVTKPNYFYSPGHKEFTISTDKNGFGWPELLVCVSNKDMTIRQSVLTDQNGNANFAIDMTDTGYIYVVITGRNTHPYFDSIGVGTYRSVHEEQGNNFHLNIRPNPSKSAVNIDFDLPLETISKLSVVNITGQNFITIHHPASDEYSLDCTAWPRGFYMVNLELQDGKILRRKLILE